MPLFSQYQQLLCKKGQRRWHTSLANAVLHMKELFMNDSFWSTFAALVCTLRKASCDWADSASQSKWACAGDRQLQRGLWRNQLPGKVTWQGEKEMSGNLSREKQITYFIALHIFKTQCKHWIMVSPHGWRDLAPPPPHFSTSQTELEWLHAHFQ